MTLVLICQALHSAGHVLAPTSQWLRVLDKKMEAPVKRFFQRTKLGLRSQVGSKDNKVCCYSSCHQIPISIY